MRVNFNPAFRNSAIFSEFKTPVIEAPKINTEHTKDEIIKCSIKNVEFFVSECKYIVIALGILYFAMKKNLKVNRLKNETKKAAELAKMKVLQPQLINISPEDLMGLH